jgi:AbrB family looped-hinge helix DNA binding protein
MGGQSGHQKAIMATRDSIADPNEPLQTLNVSAIDKSNGTVRVTIPARARDQLGIKPGDDLVLDYYRDEIHLRKDEAHGD